ncbi:MAG TPA: sporulation protein SpoOM [Cyanobacteria bacterium UBA12227]|nr:sporulation protein SpoOM [Cyanobacteria bacterium UBA12227]HAX89563.1 sporulation protein SpoOM [Cyanobacteria bacterium UBA11370]HBY78189.1 sporulation protein SpoOM [Cyanobacteria bacterium UBA11148]
MSMFKKLLASVGIGAATVDTRLYNDALIPGEMLNGEVHITGGDTSQDIEDIYLKVVTEYKRETDETTVIEECILVKYCLSEPFSLYPKEAKVIPFSLQLPYETPLTVGHQPVYVRTGLDISLAIDPKDKDYIEVHPHPLMQLVLEGLESLGFQLHKVDTEYNPHLGGRYPFIQEFEFKPIGKYQGYLDELEVIFALNSDDLDVLIEIDRRARGFGGFLAEAFDMDERYVRCRVTSVDLNYPQDVEAMLDNLIQSRI